MAKNGMGVTGLREADDSTKEAECNAQALS
jgi:hypothetical protein